MRILGIESSCDDTSVALLRCSEQGCFVLSEKTASQIEIHKKYGGVVPEIAGRMHAEKIVPLIEEITKGQERPDVIAVTAGPGLITGLIVGTEAARALSYARDIPVVAVNHLEGHIHSVEIPAVIPSLRSGQALSETKDLLEKATRDSSVITLPQNDNKKIQYPALALIVSGGHTELIYLKEEGAYKIIGKTVDDAAGECFDKVAKLLELPYPGGPQISELAEKGVSSAIDFPRPMLRENNFDFSFSGLKTSALYWLRDNSLAADKILPYNLPTGIYGQMSNPPTIHDFCASFEQAIVDVLVGKTVKAAEEYLPKTVILCGGVSANKKLRAVLQSELTKSDSSPKLLFPLSAYCMDNAAMIAIAGYYHAIKKEFTSWGDISVDPNLKLT